MLQRCLAKVCAVIFLLSTARANHSSERDRLITNLFSEYDAGLLPLDGRAVKLTLDYAFAQLIDVDEKHQSMRTMLWARLKWRDYRLAWDTTNYSGLNALTLPHERVWRPDPIVYNSIGKSEDDFDDVLVEFDGHVFFNFRTIISSTCQIQIARFPFDTQVCELQFGMWTYNSSSVDLHIARAVGDSSPFAENGEWHLVSYRAKRTQDNFPDWRHPGTKVRYSIVTYSVELRRRPLFYLFNLVLPAVIIAVVALFGFFMPYADTDYREERMTLGMTTILSMSVLLLMVASEMPNTSLTGVPLISRFYMTLIGLVALATLSTIVSLLIQRRALSPSGRPPSERLRKALRTRFACLLVGSGGGGGAYEAAPAASPATTTAVTRRISAQSIGASVQQVEDFSSSSSSSETPDANKPATTYEKTSMSEAHRGGDSYLYYQPQWKRSAIHDWVLLALALDRAFLILFLAAVVAVIAYLFSNAWR